MLLLGLNKNLQVAVHPVHGSSRKKGNGPFAVRVDRSNAIGNKHLDLPPHGRVHGTIVLGFREVSWQLVAEATGDGMLQSSEIGTLVGRKVKARKGTFAVLKNVDIQYGSVGWRIDGRIGSVGGMTMMRIVRRIRSRLLVVNRCMNTMLGSEVVTNDT